MGLLKKDKTPGEAAIEAVLAPDEPTPDEATTPSLGEAEVAMSGEGTALDDSADADPLAALTDASEPADAEAAKSDELLDLFSTVQVEAIDRTAVLGLAGDVDIVDLVAELQIVASAMGISTACNYQAAA